MAGTGRRALRLGRRQHPRKQETKMAPEQPAHGGGEQGEQLEGSLTDGGAQPGVKGADEDRSFGAGRHMQTGGTSGSTGASKAGAQDGDRDLGNAGHGGTAAGDQQTEAPSGGRVDTGQGQ
jgi:hypothetical protein